MQIFEYECRKDGEVFIGEGKPFEEHAINDAGNVCGELGELKGVYTSR